MSHRVTPNHLALAQPAVRAAAFEERAAIGDLLVRANLEYRTLVSAAIVDDYLESLRSLTQDWADKEFLVVESGGKLVGTVTLYPDASAIRADLPPVWAGLRALAVDPDARGRGVGRQLTEACVRHAARLDRPAICLHNAALQRAARALYLSLGFERCPQFDRGGSDLLDAAGAPITVEAFRLNLKRDLP